MSEQKKRDGRGSEEEGTNVVPPVISGAAGFDPVEDALEVGDGEEEETW